VALLLSVSSSSKATRQGAGSTYLVIDEIEAASGAKPKEFGNVLESDVITNVKVTEGSTTYYVPTVYEDPGTVMFHLNMKDPGSTTSPTEPSQSNQITVNRYHVAFVRSDGRNTPGVDVPYPFDGAFTGTVGKNAVSFSFVLVRAQAKLEAPLQAMRGMGGSLLISTIAEVTFYGRDQAGNAVSVVGRISVNFADWGDPA
jgi:hypothetical protein